MKQPLQQQTGMSLIEVLTALLIFSIGILGMISLQTRAMQFSTSAEDTNRASLLANELAAQMWDSGSVTVDPTAWAGRVADTVNGGLPGGTGMVTVDGNVADITITWRSPNAAAGEANRFVTQVLIPQLAPVAPPPTPPAAP
jgi:type IV pilus assembly protein PilV